MKKLTRKTLNELAQIMPVISETSQRSYMGGSGCMEATGYVGGTGYEGGTGYDDVIYNGRTLPEVTVTGYHLTNPGPGSVCYDKYLDFVKDRESTSIFGMIFNVIDKPGIIGGMVSQDIHREEMTQITKILTDHDYSLNKPFYTKPYGANSYDIFDTDGNRLGTVTKY